MTSDDLCFRHGKAIITAKYYGPDSFHGRGSGGTVRCVSLVNKSEGKHARCLRVKFNAYPVFASLLWQQMTSSRFFGIHLSSWLYCQLRNITDGNEQLPSAFDYVISLGESCSVCLQGQLSHMNIPTVCKIFVNIGVQPLARLCLEPDIRWSKRLVVELVEYVQLQDVMAWLSTLGGAYSAMGDHLCSYSEKAGQISKHQLHVALRLGNPILAAQCKVFAAFSFIQRGQLKLAAKIIREQYALATSDGIGRDGKLISSCKAAWHRIQYMKKQKKIDQEVMKSNT